MTSGKAYKLLNELIDERPDATEIVVSKDIHARLGHISAHRDKDIKTDRSVTKRTLYALTINYGEENRQAE